MALTADAANRSSVQGMGPGAHLELGAAAQAEHGADRGRHKEQQGGQGGDRGRGGGGLPQQAPDRLHRGVRGAQQHAEEVAAIAPHIAPEVVLWNTTGLRFVAKNS